MVSAIILFVLTSFVATIGTVSETAPTCNSGELSEKCHSEDVYGVEDVDIESDDNEASHLRSDLLQIGFSGGKLARDETNNKSIATSCIKMEGKAIKGHNRVSLDDKVYTEDQCARECLERDWCKAVDFGKKSGHCYLTDVIVPFERSDNYDIFVCRGDCEKREGRAITGNNRVSVDLGLTSENEELIEQKCRDECLKRDWCKAVDVNTKTGRCYLADVLVPDVSSKNYNLLICRPGCTKREGRAVKGNNRESLQDKFYTEDECMSECLKRDWCLSADLHKKEGKCYLSDTLAPEVTTSNYDLLICRLGCDEDLRGTKDASYRGCQQWSRSGKHCQPWNEQSPHTHSMTPSKKEEYGIGNHGYCRNPDGGKTIWCYTEDPEKRWDYCDPKDDSYELDEEFDPLLRLTETLQTRLETAVGSKNPMAATAVARLMVLAKSSFAPVAWEKKENVKKAVSTTLARVIGGYVGVEDFDMDDIATFAEKSLISTLSVFLGGPAAPLVSMTIKPIVAQLKESAKDAIAGFVGIESGDWGIDTIIDEVDVRVSKAIATVLKDYKFGDITKTVVEKTKRKIRGWIKWGKSKLFR